MVHFGGPLLTQHRDFTHWVRRAVQILQWENNRGTTYGLQCKTTHVHDCNYKGQSQVTVT